jgi:hypothetical protein
MLFLQLKQMKILLLSAYDANSHQYWRPDLMSYFDGYEWTLLILPARYFSWRIRGNTLIWALENSEQLNSVYDLIVAVSIVDLATLRGLVPALANTATVLYFHENQFAYPVYSAAHKSTHAIAAEPLMVQLYSALCADCVCFNSDFNRQSFFDGLALFLKKLPDGVQPGVLDMLAQKSHTLPVPLFGKEFDSKLDCSHTCERAPHSVEWNHRWEYDKGPERLLACIRGLPPSAAITFHILG